MTRTVPIAMSRWPAAAGPLTVIGFACALVLAACVDPGDCSVAVDLMPPARLADAPTHFPEEDLAPGQVQGTAGPATDRVTRMLARHAAETPNGADVPALALVIRARVAGDLVGMAFPADPDAALGTFVIDDHGRLVGTGVATVPRIDDPLLRWKVEGQSGDDSPSLAWIGGWAAPSVMTVALRQDDKWIVADTTAVPSAGARAWAVALDDHAWLMAPFDEVAVYDDGGRLLAASPAAFDALPRVAAGLRGGGWRSGDVGLRLAADVDAAGLPYAPARPVARRTVTITNTGGRCSSPTTNVACTSAPARASGRSPTTSAWTSR